MKFIFTYILTSFFFAVNAQMITEFHYDNIGTDANERIEITFPAGTNITGWNVVLYNGTGGVTYDTDLVGSGALTSEGGFDIYVISYPSNGIQNGSPDAIALVNASNVVMQFISYEGVLTATNGPANGTISTDIIAFEDGSGTTIGSIQFNSATNTWATNPSQNSFGQLNALLLPVKLQSFTATNKTNTIALDWKVEQESNITTYEVERSINSTDFTRVATVVAQNFANYTVIDNNPINGTLYYRLKINEQNGIFNYSPIAKVKMNGKALTINAIYPSPAKEFVKLNINNNVTTNATIDIVDFKGKTIVSQNATLMNGLTEKTFNITTLKAGMYMIRIIANGDVTIEKFIKQ